MYTQLLGIALIVIGLILSIPQILFIIQKRQQGHRPRTVLAAFWDANAGISVFVLGVLLFFDNRLTVATWRPYVLVGRLLLIGSIVLAAYERYREMLRNRRFEKEINAIKEQIASQGESADLLNNLGYCYREIRELDEARRILRHAVSIDSNKAIIHTNLGNVYFEFGQYQQALEEYRKAKVLEPDSVGVDKNIRIVLEQLR